LTGNAGIGFAIEPEHRLLYLRRKIDRALRRRIALVGRRSGSSNGGRAQDQRQSRELSKDAAEDGWNRMVGWFKKYKILG
jgi:hypothetical protein